MADQTINQLTTVAGQDLDRAADKVAVWDNSAAVTKGLPVQDVVTTGTVDPGSSSQVTTRVNKIVACTQTEYDSTIAGGGNTPDPATLYVITDGKTADSYNGQIETPATKTYTIDAKVAFAREITSFYCSWTEGASPAGTIDLQVGGTSVLTATHTIALGTTTFTGSIKTDGTEDVAADAVITLVIGGSVADVTDLVFVVGYQS